jgi:ArsR family transcriptional regulator
MGQSRISRHLKILVLSGLVIYRRDGLWSFYSIPGKGHARKFIDTNSYLFIMNPLLKADLRKSEEIIKGRLIETTQLFNSLAGNWESIKQQVFGEFDVNNEILRQVENCGIAVDLGCGIGDLVGLLKNKAKRVIGVDNSPKMLAKAKYRFNSDIEQIEFRIGDIEHLPLKDHEADFAVFNMVLHHLSSPVNGLNEAFRVLDSNGKLIVVDLLKHSDEEMRTKYGDRWLGFKQKEMENWFNNIGFKVLEKKIFSLSKGLKLILFKTNKKGELKNAGT